MIDNEELIKEAKARYRKAHEHWGEWRKEAIECDNFRAGRQWKDSDVTALEKSGKAPIVMNRIKPRVAAVGGMEIANRQELRYQPRETTDGAVVSLLNDASEWTRDQSMTEDEESQAFDDTVVRGIGATETVMDYEENLDGMAAVNYRDSLKFDWDPNSRKRNFVDRMYHFYSDDFDRADAAAMFPDFDEDKFSQSALGIGDLTTDGKEPHNADDAKFYPTQVPADEESESKKVRIVKYEYVRLEPAWRVVKPSTGQLTLIMPDEADELVEQLEEQGVKAEFVKIKSGQNVRLQEMVDGVLQIPYVEQRQRRFYRAYFTGDEVIEHEESPFPHGFTDNFMTWERDPQKGIWFGMVRGLRDPQSLINKFMSQAIYIYTVNPKGGAFVEKDAVQNMADFEEKYARPDAVSWLLPGGMNKILERKPGAYPSDLDKLIAYMIDGIPAMDGLNPEALGMAGRDQPGILENMRKQASMNILAPLFDAKRKYHKVQGKVLMYYIAKYFTDEQLRRIVGEERFNPELVAMLRKQDVQNYDVIVDDAPNSPNKREFIMSVLADVNRQAPQIAPATAKLMVRNLPLDPEELTEIEQNIDSLMNPMNNPQVQQMMQKVQQELQKLQQENIKLKTDQTSKMAQVQVDAQVSQAELGMKRQEMLMEHSLDREKMEKEFMLKMREMMLEVMLETKKIESQERVGMEAARNQPQQPAA